MLVLGRVSDVVAIWSFTYPLKFDDFWRRSSSTLKLGAFCLDMPPALQPKMHAASCSRRPGWMSVARLLLNGSGFVAEGSRKTLQYVDSNRYFLNLPHWKHTHFNSNYVRKQALFIFHMLSILSRQPVEMIHRSLWLCSLSMYLYLL